MRSPYRRCITLGLVFAVMFSFLLPFRPAFMRAASPYPRGEVHQRAATTDPATRPVRESTGSLIPTGPGLLWRTAPATRPLLTTPVAGPDGTVYAATADGTLYAFSPDGHPVWTLRTAITTRLSPPAVGSDGTSYWSLPGG